MSLSCNKDKKTSTRDVKEMRVSGVTYYIFLSCSPVYSLAVQSQSIARSDEENAETMCSKEKILFPRYVGTLAKNEPRSLWRRRHLDNNAHFISLVKANLWPHPACYGRQAYGNSEGSLHQLRSSSVLYANIISVELAPPSDNRETKNMTPSNSIPISPHKKSFLLTFWSVASTVITIKFYGNLNQFLDSSFILFALKKMIDRYLL